MQLAEEIAGRRSAALDAAALRKVSASGGHGADAEGSGREGDLEENVDPPSSDALGALDDADLDFLDSLDISGRKAKPARAAHKFHKKPARTKLRSGDGIEVTGGGEKEGASVGYGTRGGIVKTAF